MLSGYLSRYSVVKVFRFRSEPCQSFVVILSGFECATFSVEDVIDARETAIANGGHPSGEVVTLTIATGVQVTWCSVTDPEGNVIELQSWLK